MAVIPDDTLARQRMLLEMQGRDYDTGEDVEQELNAETESESVSGEAEEPAA